MAAASSIIPDRLRTNSPSFVFLDLQVDDDFDEWSFTDLIFSFRHNYTIQYLTLIRSDKKEERGKQSRINPEAPQKRTIEELRLLVEEVLRLPKLKRLDFENFEEGEFDKLKDLWQSTKRCCSDICSLDPIIATSA